MRVLTDGGALVSFYWALALVVTGISGLIPWPYDLTLVVSSVLVVACGFLWHRLWWAGVSERFRKERFFWRAAHDKLKEPLVTGGLDDRLTWVTPAEEVLPPKRKVVGVAPTARGRRNVFLFGMTVAALALASYLLWGGLFGINPGEPEVELSAPEEQGNYYRIQVSEVSESRFLGNYAVVLERDGAVVVHFEPLRDGVEDGLSLTDIQRDGNLNPGDYFWVSCTQGCEYDLQVIWAATGKVVGSVTWLA